MTGDGAASERDFWEPLRRATSARIGLGRAGDAVPTSQVLAFGAAHALARDAVRRSLDVDAVVAGLAGLGLGQPTVLASAAPDRATYLARPDLGRVPGTPLPPRPARPAGLAVVVADGLSAQAAQQHAVPLLAELLPLLDPTVTVAPPVVAVGARVALGDHAGRALRASLVLVLIGERPGLSAADSLGAYLTWRPRPGAIDADRNCVSNIRPPHGLGYGTAARTLAGLIAGARRMRGTGVRLKEVSGAPGPGGLCAG